MNAIQKRIVIAKATGWTSICTVATGLPHYGIVGEDVVGSPPTGGHTRWLPDYTSDLNAMREAVMSLDDSKGECVRFCKVLEAVLERSDCCWIECAVPSAEYLADAFIETLNLQPPA